MMENAYYAATRTVALGCAEMKAEHRVKEKYPSAYSKQDRDGVWRIWCPEIRGPLSDGLGAKTEHDAWEQAYSQTKNWLPSPE